MIVQLSSGGSLSDVDRSRICDLAAEQAYAELAVAVDWLESQADEPGLRIHCLFARLYLYDTKHWFNTPVLDEDSEFLKLFVARFMQGYFKQVIEVAKTGEGCGNGSWASYFKRTDKLTMRSNIFSHLVVVVLAFHTQICCDISKALYLSAKDHQALFGRPVELTRNRDLFFHPANRAVFQGALLEFISFHRIHQSVFRRLTLSFFVKILGMTRGIWWPVLNGWRRKSWEAFETKIKQHPLQ
ncbi:MAG: hypothetical protein ABJN65_04440 [Parasphingorhabdus sp.]